MTRIFALLLTLLTLFTLPAHSDDDKTVLLAILARNKAHVLPRYLQCIENLDYDKKLITIYFNTNNNEDNTKDIIADWARKNGSQYRQIIIDGQEIEALKSTNPHEWNNTRFKVLANIRNKSLQKAKEYHCDYYFVVDCDNFITPCTLKVLVSKDKPIIAPLLHSIPEKNNHYSNFYCDMKTNGSFKDHPDYRKILQGEMVGTFKVPVVHCTYLIKTEYVDKLNYIDDTNDYEYHIFSRTARKNQVDQYICNEKEFGVLVSFFTNVSRGEEKRRLIEYFAQQAESDPFMTQPAQSEENKTILLAILARNKAHVLPRYLQCIENFDYDKKLITIYINTNNNEDDTKKILEKWIEKNAPNFREIILDSQEIDALQATKPHEWTHQRLKLLGTIRDKSLKMTKKYGCDFYFTADCDIFLDPCTLKVLISKDKPIIAPLLRSIPESMDPYSNYFCDVTESGYYKDHPNYDRIFNCVIVGMFKVPVVHHAYLIKVEYIEKLHYVDDTNNHEFIVFSRSARNNHVDQYICNERNFGTNVHFFTEVTLEEEKQRLIDYFKEGKL